MLLDLVIVSLWFPFQWLSLDHCKSQLSFAEQIFGLKAVELLKAELVYYRGGVGFGLIKQTIRMIV